VFGVDVAFDDGWAKVFVSHDNRQVSRISQVVEDLSLKEEKIRVDMAFSPGERGEAGKAKRDAADNLGAWLD
jgi:hypothetical protein